MTLQRFAPMEKIHFKTFLLCKLLECNGFWHFIFFYLMNMIWKEKLYSILNCIYDSFVCFFLRIELDMTVFAVQSGFAYPLLLISLRHSKWIFKPPPFDVIFTGLSWSCVVREPSKWCESNIRECSFSPHLRWICSPAVSQSYWNVLVSRIIYGTNIRNIPEMSQFSPSCHNTMKCSVLGVKKKKKNPSLSHFMVAMRYFSFTLNAW